MGEGRLQHGGRGGVCGDRELEYNFMATFKKNKIIYKNKLVKHVENS